jgi:hypothetical protein
VDCVGALIGLLDLPIVFPARILGRRIFKNY